MLNDHIQYPLLLIQFQSHDVIAQEVYGEDAIRVTPPPPPPSHSATFDPTTAAVSATPVGDPATFNATAAVFHGIPGNKNLCLIPPIVIVEGKSWAKLIHLRKF